MNANNIYEEKSRSIIENTPDFSNYDPHESYMSNSIYIENKEAEEFYEFFQELRNAWLNDTAFESGYKNKINHPAYLKIVSMGELIIPILVEDMVENKTPWHYALVDITQKNPIREESAGRANKIIEDWHAWAKENNYV